MPIIPSFELYARYLLRANEPAAALQILKSGNYTSSRNRGSTLLLFARAHEQLGDLPAACAQYAVLVDNFSISDLELKELDEARAFLTANCGATGLTLREAPAMIPRSFSHVNLQEGVGAKRTQLTASGWDWSAPEETTPGHC